MSPRDFAFWLQGWLELERPKSISGQKLQVIREHLSLVFQHVAGGPPVEPMDHPTPVEKCPSASGGEPVEPDKRKVIQEQLDEAAKRIDRKKLEDFIRELQRPQRRVYDPTKLIC